jgi:hypothetical protein
VPAELISVEALQGIHAKISGLIGNKMLHVLLGNLVARYKRLTASRRKSLCLTVRTADLHPEFTVALPATGCDRRCSPIWKSISNRSFLEHYSAPATIAQTYSATSSGASIGMKCECADNQTSCRLGKQAANWGSVGEGFDPGKSPEEAPARRTVTGHEIEGMTGCRSASGLFTPSKMAASICGEHARRYSPSPGRRAYSQ